MFLITSLTAPHPAHIIDLQKCWRQADTPTPLTLTTQVSCSTDGSVGLWDPERQQQLGQFLGHQSAVSAVVAVVRRRWRAHWGLWEGSGGFGTLGALGI